MTTTTHTLRDYIHRAMPVLLEIPGYRELLNADDRNYDTLAEQYPDAVFAMMVTNNLFNHDWELAEIHQQAFSAILDRESIASVRHRYSRRMDAYLENHLWDD